MNSRSRLVVRSLPASLLILAATAALQACAPPTSSGPSPLSDRELTDNTDIFIDSDQYYIKATGVSSHETSYEAPNEQALSENPAAEDLKPDAGDTPKPTKKTAKAKSTAKSKPVDVEFVLTKSKDISVGLTSGEERARTQNEDQAFIPASITKVITTAAALRTLGADFKFKTQIVFDLSSSGQASNVVVVADGDPTVGVADFQSAVSPRPLQHMAQIASALQSRGVRDVTGEIRFAAVDPRLEGSVYAPGVPLEDIRECYGALAGSFNFRSNCARVRVNSKSDFSWENPMAGIFLTTSVETEPAEANRLSLEPVLSAERLLQGFKLRGTYAQKAPRVLQLRLPVGNASAWYAQGLLAALRDVKIGLSKVTAKVVQNANEHAAVMAEVSHRGNSTITIESAPLSAIIEATNKPSDNFFADAVFKAIGSRSGSRDSSVVGASRGKIKATIEAWLRADGHGAWANELSFLEGAGLSSDNRATPRAFLSVLRQIAREPTFASLWQSLPIAGRDGTLADRMRETVAADRVRAKTGTLKGSYQLVGYIPKKRGSQTEYVPFVILTSTTARNRGTVRKFQDALVVKMTDTILRDAN